MLYLPPGKVILCWKCTYMCVLLYQCPHALLQIIRSQDEKLLEAEVLETKIRADANQQNEIVREVCTVIICSCEKAWWYNL